MADHTPSPDVVRVESQEQLEAICRNCRVNGQFAFDTEFVMEDRFEAELCLIQIADGQGVAIIDPFLDLDLDPLWALLHDEQVVTVVHAGQEDLGIFVQRTGRVPRRTYDIQIAAGFAGYDYPLSLQKLARMVLRVGLHKSKTLTDWRRRPLTTAQIHYAAEDVSYLLAIRAKLDKRIAQTDRMEWVQAEFDRFEALSLYRRPEQEKLTRLKGSGALAGRQLVALRELLAWREDVAQQVDRPLRAVLKDHLLVEIAKHELDSPDEVRALRGLNLKDKHVRTLCGAVQRAVATPRDQWPVPSPRHVESRAETALVPLITGVIHSICIEKAIAYGLVASKKSICEMVCYCAEPGSKQREEVELLSGWRYEAVGALLEEVLTGHRRLRVDLSDGNPIISVTDPE